MFDCVLGNYISVHNSRYMKILDKTLPMTTFYNHQKHSTSYL